MKQIMLGAGLALAIAAPVEAATYDLRSFVESNWNYVTPQQDGAMWTARYGDQDGSLLPPLGGATYGYACGTCTQIGQLINAGDPTWLNSAGYVSAGLPTFDGVFLHPGPSAGSSVAIVFTAQSDVALNGVTIQAEMVLNGMHGDGVDISVRHARGGIVTALGSYGVSGPNYSEQAFNFGPTPLLFVAGDRIEVDVGPAGGYNFDHLNINVLTTAVPEPGSYAMMLAGLSLLGFFARRKAG